jgi:DNA-nicking Smr family endonuclease
MAKRPSVDQRGAAPELSAEAKSFREAMRDVKPLRPATQAARLATGKAAVPKTAAPRPAAPRPAAPKPRARRASGASADVPEPGNLPLIESTLTAADALSFRRPGVRDQALRRLRRGSYPVEAEIDLHGLNQSGARDNLADFLTYSRSAGYRCVRVIHGKGYRSGARGPILKAAVNDWLRRNADVMAFASARPVDGGTGAVYVLLRV